MTTFSLLNFFSSFLLTGCLVQLAVRALSPEAVEISASFPLDNQFGVVFNGQPNKILLKILNMGSHPEEDVMRIHSVWNEFREIGGRERLLQKGNPTRSKRTFAPATTAQTVPYYFNAEQKEGDLNLKVWVEWSGPKGRRFRNVAYDSTVTIREPPTRWFDPQLILLYLILGSGFGLVAYLGYVSWLKPGKTRKPFKEAPKGKPSSAALAPLAPKASKVSTPTGGSYDEEWIPTGHMPSSKKSTTEGGGETSGTEGKPRRRKR